MNKLKAIKISNIFLILVVFLFVLICGKLVYVGISNDVDGINLTTLADNRNTVNAVITANRGTIYDSNGEILAQSVNSYTVIAYLSSTRTTNDNYPHHVVDKRKTAELLAPIINMTEKKILELLNTDAYQVELGPGGRGITELVKEKIEELDLPGIDFISSTKRYYPKANFLSYTLGYSKTDENANIFGELGLELYYNDILTGTNGYKTYQQDIYGYKIANTPSIEEDAVSGNDIYLTIDTNIQLFAESAIDSIEEAGVSWATVSVTEAKTGKILAVASSPNYDPNKRDMKSYSDPFVSYTYEPGSTMKIFSWLAAIENGLYKGETEYKSGSVKIDDIKIKDWNNVGWGTLTLDEGFIASSNVGATKLAMLLGREKLKDFYSSLGFGIKTGIPLSSESNGTLNFQYPIEVANAAFGQGISVTGIQMVQALTAIANDGVVLKPYLIEKIVDNSGEVLVTGTREELKTIASKENVEKVKNLMYDVVNSNYSFATGKKYKVNGYDIIGKTGTAQIASTSGGYLNGSTDYIRSFAGMFPKDDPQIIIYIAVSKIKNPNVLTSATKTLIKDVGTYIGINKNEIKESESSIVVGSYINKNADDIVSELEENGVQVVTLGTGVKIINQYPQNNSKISKNDKIFLLTNNNNYIMPDITGWSRSDVSTFASLINLKVTFEGYGYVKSYSFKNNNSINIEETLTVKLESMYEEKKQ